jgi:hypothetical protein
MDSFSMICSISGLGISAGTPVRCLLLTASPYGDDDPRKTWIVRTPPLRAVYNDYGSIEDVHKEDAFIAKLWLRGLREDVVEKGLGDNSCHDVPVAIDMSFNDMMAAIQARRLQVSQDAKHFWRSPRRGPGSDKAYIPPLMRRVEQLLESQFPGSVSRHAEHDKYVVDEPVPHMVRVRFGAYQHGEECLAALEIARRVVEGYALGPSAEGVLVGPSTEGGTVEADEGRKLGPRGLPMLTKLTGVITAGSGRYADSADLLVFPLPASTDEHIVGPQWDMAPGQPADGNKVLRVGLAMIREDVWQALIAYPHGDYLAHDCVVCGQSPCYHKEDRSCPTTSINGTPYKKHAKGAKYTHGPVFPAGVPHRVEQREWSEYVWYGLEAYKEGTRATWKAALEEFSDRKGANKDARVDVKLDKACRGNAAKEEARITALPPEERAAIEVKRKAEQNEWETKELRKKEHPFFGDFKILYHANQDFRMPGAWVFHDSIPGVIGVSEHFSMLIADKVEAPAALLDAVAELSAVRHVLGGLGVVLRPSVSSGPQYPEWGESMRFARSVLRIAEAAGKAHECEASEPATLDEAFEAVTKRVKPQQAKAFEAVAKEVKPRQAKTKKPKARPRRKRR